jgi:hypothetical protein
MIGRLVLIHFATILTMNAASMNLTHTLLLTPLALRKCSQVGISACLMKPFSPRSLYAIFFPKEGNVIKLQA